MARRRIRKALIVTSIVIAVLVLLIILVVSPAAKYLIEKYDEKYTGRQIEIGWLYINPFTGTVNMRNLKIFESKSNNIFLSAKGISVNVSITKLFSKVYEVSRFTLDTPKARIIRDGDKFNFSDIIEKFSSTEDTVKKETSEEVKLSYKNIRIKNGEFYYIDRKVPVNYFIKDVDLVTKGKTWDVDTISLKYSFLSGPGSGSVKGSFSFNMKTMDYSAATIVDSLDLKIAEQYMNQVTNFGHLRATLDANLRTAGNVDDSMSLSTKGRLQINNLHFGKDVNEDYLSFDKMVINFADMNLKKNTRIIDTFLLVQPVIKYERYDKLDNIQLMFGEKGANIDSVKADPEQFNLVLELADMIKMLSETFRQDYFKINYFTVQDANLQFNDFSIAEKFSMALNPFTITADSIDKNSERITIKAKSLIQPHGEASIHLTVNPKNAGYFEMSYKFRDIPAAMFNPYLISFTSFPLDRGTIEFHGDWNVDNSVVKSENHFIVIDPRVSKKIRKKDNKWVPMPLIMSFVRERGNVIDYKIPITGNLKDPKFKISDVFLDLLKNIFVKPPSSPYIFEVRNTENKVEKSLTLKWIMRTAKLLPNQERFIERISKFLEENPEASITVNPMLYAAKEREYILLYEAKKKYYLDKNNKQNGKLEEEDSLKIEKMSVKDSAFLKYLTAYVKDTSLFTIQEKCRVYLGEKLVQQKYRSLIDQREKEFLKYFKENNTDSQIKILNADNTVPYNGFSYYKISYKGDIPEDLMEAYQKLEEFNEENPRRRYQQWRE